MSQRSAFHRCDRGGWLGRPGPRKDRDRRPDHSRPKRPSGPVLRRPHRAFAKLPRTRRLLGCGTNDPARPREPQKDRETHRHHNRPRPRCDPSRRPPPPQCTKRTRIGDAPRRPQTKKSASERPADPSRRRPFCPSRGRNTRSLFPASSPESSPGNTGDFGFRIADCGFCILHFSFCIFHYPLPPSKLPRNARCRMRKRDRPERCHPPPERRRSLRRDGSRRPYREGAWFP